MNSQTTQRLFITLVVAALMWLLCAGIISLNTLQKLRSLELDVCMKADSFDPERWPACYRHVQLTITPTFLDYLSPFIPILLLAWISWVLTINFHIQWSNKNKKTRKFIAGIAYLVGIIVAYLIPLNYILSRSAADLQKEGLSESFTLPWLAICWISIPLFFQILLDKDKQITEFRHLKKIIYIVLASPFLAILLASSRF